MSLIIKDKTLLFFQNHKKVVIAILVVLSLLILAYVYACYLTASGAIIEN